MQVIQKIRHFLLILLSKEFLVFLFFLFISGIFWLLMSLNETFEKEVVIPLRMTNIPKNVVVINDISPTLKVTLRDKGYTIGGYPATNNNRLYRLCQRQRIWKCVNERHTKTNLPAAV